MTAYPVGVIAYSVALRTDPKAPGWALFVTTDEGDHAQGLGITSCLMVDPSRSVVIGKLFEALHVRPGDVYVADIEDGERARLAHPGNGFSLLEEPPEGLVTWLQLAEIVNR